MILSKIYFTVPPSRVVRPRILPEPPSEVDRFDESYLYLPRTKFNELERGR